MKYKKGNNDDIGRAEIRKEKREIRIKEKFLSTQSYLTSKQHQTYGTEYRIPRRRKSTSLKIHTCAEGNEPHIEKLFVGNPWITFLLPVLLASWTIIEEINLGVQQWFPVLWHFYLRQYHSKAHEFSSNVLFILKE